MNTDMLLEREMKTLIRNAKDWLGLENPEFTPTATQREHALQILDHIHDLYNRRLKETVDLYNGLKAIGERLVFPEGIIDPKTRDGDLQYVIWNVMTGNVPESQPLAPAEEREHKMLRLLLELRDATGDKRNQLERQLIELYAQQDKTIRRMMHAAKAAVKHLPLSNPAYTHLMKVTEGGSTL